MKETRPFPIKKAIILLAVTAALFVIYQVMIALEIMAVVHVYWIGLCVLAMVYIAINRGVFRPSRREELPNEWSNEEKDSVIAEQKRRLKLSRPILYVIVGIMLTLIFDTAYIFATVNLGINI